MSDKDITNLSSSPRHRLPTRSAAEALQTVTSPAYKPISVSLPTLDALLQGQELALQGSEDALPGGLSRGLITEVYGPPGVGKTTFAMQAAANALRSGDAVVWADSSRTVVGPRLKDIISRACETQNAPVSAPPTPTEVSDRFHHFNVPTLPHLLALLIHTSALFPPPNTSLIVVDSISSLFTLAFPKTVEKLLVRGDAGKKYDAAQWAGSRRWAVMSDFISKVGKLAATSNIAILLISQTTTRIRVESDTVLHPVLSGSAWDNGVNARLVLFRDWLLKRNEGSSQGINIPKARFAGIVKAAGVTYDGLNKVVPFIIKSYGVEEVEIDPKEIELHTTPATGGASLKRKRNETLDAESGDEDLGSDEEFGWTGDAEDPLNIGPLAE